MKGTKFSFRILEPECSAYMSKQSSVQPQEKQVHHQVPLIYILGNSHSGSTLLSFLLTYHPDIINLGELKSKTWLKARNCSCGHPVSTCNFYGEYFPVFNALKEPAMQSIRTVNPAQFLLKKKIKPDKVTSDNLRTFYQSVCERMIGLYPDARYIVDSSKSVWLLNAWTQTLPKENIKIIWLRRQTKANVASFIKRGSPFLKSLLTVLGNNKITKHFLRSNHLDYLEVNYDRFYDAYQDEAQRMSSFLGLNIPVTNGANQNHHVISGNEKTRQAFANQFTGLHKDDEWERILTGTQKKILSWLS